MNLKVYSEDTRGRDGKLYGVRYLLTPEELAGLQAAGIIGDACEVVGMQEAADSVIAAMELESHAEAGGAIQ